MSHLLGNGELHIVTPILGSFVHSVQCYAQSKSPVLISHVIVTSIRIIEPLRLERTTKTTQSNPSPSYHAH